MAVSYKTMMKNKTLAEFDEKKGKKSDMPSESNEEGKHE